MKLSSINVYCHGTVEYSALTYFDFLFVWFSFWYIKTNMYQ